MRFHPDVLRCHEQFGGDLEDMQRRYDASDQPASTTQPTPTTTGVSEAMVEAFKAKYREFWPGAWPEDAPMSKEFHEVLRAAIEAALSTAPAGDVLGWMPIETAPKDGTFIITRVGRWTRPAVVHWASYEDVAKWGADPEHFMEEDHFLQYWLEVQYDPTEWLPLEALDRLSTASTAGKG